jgi:hypothetical protein
MGPGMSGQNTQGMGPGMAGGRGPGQRLSAEEKEKRCQANPERCAKMKERKAQRQEQRQDDRGREDAE